MRIRWWLTYLNVRDLLKYDKVIMTLEALEVVTEHLEGGSIAWQSCICTMSSAVR